MEQRIYKLTIVVFIYVLCAIRYPLVYGSFDQQYGGGRPLGMGGAFTGLSDSGDAMYYNAAGLAQVGRPEVMGAYSRLYLGLDDNSNISFGNLSVVYPLKAALNTDKSTPEVTKHLRGDGAKGQAGKKGKKAVNATQAMEQGGIRSDIGIGGAIGFGVETFSLDSLYNETVIGLYYGRRISKVVMVGMGLKYLTIGYGRDEYTSSNPVFDGGLSKSNISVDMGVLALLNEKVSAGLAIRDMNMPDMGLKYEDPVSRKIMGGVAYRTPEYSITSDIMADSQNDVKVMAGGERWFMDHTAAVRAGFGIGSRRYSRVNIGLGYEGDNIFVDYTFFYPLSGLSDMYGSHEATFGYRFGLSMRNSYKKVIQLKEQMKKDIVSGDYQLGMNKVDKCLGYDPNDVLCNRLKPNLGLIIKELGGEYKVVGKAGNSVRKGIVQYLMEDDAAAAVETLVYAFSIDPENNVIDKLTKLIAKQNNVNINAGAKSWNTAEHKIFQALDKFKEKKYDESIKLCEEALRLEPNNVTAYKRLGSIFYVLKDYERARFNWNKAIKLAPKDPEMEQIKELMKNMK